MTTSQEDLINFVTSEDTLRKAAEGSMAKRAAALYPQEDAELRDAICEIINDAHSWQITKDETGEQLFQLIKQYGLQERRKAEYEESEAAAEFAEDVLEQFGYDGRSGGLSTLERAESIVRKHKQLTALKNKEIE
jgi:hypothetical protein